MNHTPIDLSEKELKKFLLKIEIKPSNVCWNWLYAINKDGYGRFCVNGKMLLVSRIIYFITYNIDPGEYLVCHTCDNPTCYNPTHLFLGTRKSNSEDSMRKGRHQSKNKHWNCKLTKEKVFEIRELSKIMTQKEIAKIYNLSNQHVSDLISKKYWN